MKKPNRIYIILTFVILLTFVSCVDRTGNFKYYKFKNETGSSIKLKFYSNYKIIGGFNSIIIENKSYSDEFYQSSGIQGQDFFIYNVDSIDFISNDKLLKRYKRSDGVGSKTPYSTDYFDQKNIGTKGETINVYTILPEDFIAK